MWVEQITIKNCRILNAVEITLSPSLNIISGDNGSGKTSFLEALSLLSRGRSFRTSRISDLISHGKSSVLISSSIRSESKIATQIGIEKSVGKTRIRINKKDIYSQSELSRHLPITVIHPESIKLITGSPAERRAFIDWICFYLYPGFHSIWKSYQHILKQRNSCLKHKVHRYALEKWTIELAELQPEIHDYRCKAIKAISPSIVKITSDILASKTCGIELKSGFPSHVKFEQDSILEYYKEKQELDLKFGRTHAGVHRSDLTIQLDGKPANQTASRGQLKLLAISLLLAQSNVIHSSNTSKAIILIDDITAELDPENKHILLDYLNSLDQQLILTTPSETKLKLNNSTMFHVKHGELKAFP